MDISIAKLTDVPALCLLLDELFTQEVEFAAEPEKQIRGLTAIIEDPGIGIILLARQGLNVLGMVSLLYTVSTALGGRVALLEDMVVTAEARGSGVGSRLIKEAVKTARANGCQRITLLTDIKNEAAQRFYQQQGFTLSSMMPLRLLLE